MFCLFPCLSVVCLLLLLLAFLVFFPCLGLLVMAHFRKKKKKSIIGSACAFTLVHTTLRQGACLVLANDTHTRGH